MEGTAETASERSYSVWLPYVRSGSGADVFTLRLAKSLTDGGHEIRLTSFPHFFQYVPFLLRLVKPPKGSEVTVANSWYAFAFRRRGRKLVAIAHHCVLDPAYIPFRSKPQGLFHELVVRRFERWSFAAADSTVAVSEYTAHMLRKLFELTSVDVVLNGIDTDFFSPNSVESDSNHRPFRLFYVGNLSRRKGADLLAPIMDRLGEGFELYYTCGLREARPLLPTRNMIALPRLSELELLRQYRLADAVLFPSRLEGFGYCAAEALACGIPVVASKATALPEVVEHGVSGLLCAPGDVDGFVEAILALDADANRRRAMGENARASALKRFTLDKMARGYGRVFAGLLAATSQEISIE